MTNKEDEYLGSEPFQKWFADNSNGLRRDSVYSYKDLKEALYYAYKAGMLEAAPPADAEPVRVELGHGKYGIHYGTLEGVPCLNISDKGVGIVGAPTTHENLAELELEHEIVTITFLNKASYDVFKKTVDSIPEFQEPVKADVEPVAYGVYDESDKTWEYISEYRSLANDHINGMDSSVIKSMRLAPLYTHPPADKDAERFRFLMDSVKLTIDRTNLKALFTFAYWGTKEEVIAAIDKAMGEV